MLAAACAAPSAPPFQSSGAMRLTRLCSEGLVMPWPSASSAKAGISHQALGAGGIASIPAISKMMPASTSRASPKRCASRPSSPPWTIAMQIPAKPSSSPTSRGPRPSTASPHRAKLDSRPENTKNPAKYTASSISSSGIENTRSAAVLSSSRTTWRSGSRISTAPIASARTEAPADARIGSSKFGSSPPTASAPRNGPITKPMPKAAPSMPMPRARRSGPVLSATQPCPAAIQPPMAPASARLANSSPSPET